MNAKNSNELHWKLMKILKLDGIITEYIIIIIVGFLKKR